MVAGGGEQLPYHRLAHGRGWWRPLVEVIVAVALWLFIVILLMMVIVGISGVGDMDELDAVSTAAMSLLVLAALLPACRVAARVMNRRSGLLSSTRGALRWRWLMRCVLIKLALVGVVFVILIIVGLVVSGDSDTETKTGFVGWATFLPMAAVVLFIVPFQAAGEEYLFRGTLLQAIGAWIKSPWPAIVISGVLFSLVHWTGIEPMLFLFVMGCVTAWLTIRTGGLEAAIAEHALSNMIVMLLSATVKVTTLGTEDPNAGVTWHTSAVQAVVLCIYAALITRSYRRIESAQRLTAVANQVEQHAPERGVPVEHADHGGHAEPLPPEQQ